MASGSDISWIAERHPCIDLDTLSLEGCEDGEMAAVYETLSSAASASSPPPSSPPTPLKDDEISSTPHNSFSSTDFSSSSGGKERVGVWREETFPELNTPRAVNEWAFNGHDEFRDQIETHRTSSIHTQVASLKSHKLMEKIGGRIEHYNEDDVDEGIHVVFNEEADPEEAVYMEQRRKIEDSYKQKRLKWSSGDHQDLSESLLNPPLNDVLFGRGWRFQPESRKLKLNPRRKEVERERTEENDPLPIDDEEKHLEVNSSVPYKYRYFHGLTLDKEQNKWVCKENGTNSLDSQGLNQLFIALRGWNWQTVTGKETEVHTIEWFDEDISYCCWEGISCVRNSQTGEYRVTSLGLSNSNLNGIFPDVSKYLTGLRYLFLNNDSFKYRDPWNTVNRVVFEPSLANYQLEFLGANGLNLNEVPSFVCNMTSLRSLQIARNNIRTLPVCLTKLPDINVVWASENNIYFVDEAFVKSRLVILDVGMNQLQQFPDIPDDSSLEDVYLEGNLLKRVPSFGRSITRAQLQSNRLESLDGIELAPNLQELYIDDNKLTSLPDTIGSLIHLQELSASGNFLEVISPEIRLTNLSHLDLSKNSLSIFPKEIGELPSLKTLTLSYNVIFELPDIFQDWQSSGLSLFLNDNRLLSRFPPSMKHLSVDTLHAPNCAISDLSNLPRTLTDLVLYKNRITEIPEDFPPSIEQVYMGENKISSFKANLKNSRLNTLSLSDNLLTEFPCEVVNAKYLTAVYLSRNKIKSIPCSLEDTSITTLLLSYNQLPNIPMNMIPSRIERLYIRGNGISELPTGIFFLPNITTLDIGKNLITSLPETLVYSKFEAIYLDSNRLVTLPAPKSVDTNLAYASLQLQYNLFEEVPEIVCRFNQIDSLHIEGNKIREIPACVNNVLIQSIFFHSNPLKTLPPFLRRLSTMTSLDLSNTLIEFIPPGVSEMVSLNVLKVHNVTSLVTIPAMLASLLNLQIIDIRNTSIVLLPDELMTSPSLEVLIVRHSKVERVTGIEMGDGGTECLGKETRVLRYIDLSHNMMEWTGEESYTCFCGLPNLSYMDLSHNYLVTFFNCWYDSITFLDVSYNTDLYSFQSGSMPYGNVLDASNINMFHELLIAQTIETESSDLKVILVNSVLSSDLIKNIEFVRDQDSSLISLYTSPRIACYPLTYNGYDMQILPEQLGYSYCWCSTTDHYWNPDVKECLMCPGGLECGRTVEDAVFRVKENYYPISDNKLCNETGVDILQCSLIECIVPDVCNPNKDSPYECFEGHDVLSPVCSRCVDGYYNRNDSCKVCPSLPEVYIPMVTLLFFAGAFLYAFLKQKRLSHGFSRYGTLETFIGWMQITFVLWKSVSNAQNARGNAGGTLPYATPLAFTAAYFQPFAWECVFPSINFVTYFWIAFASPVFLIVGFGLLYIVLAFILKQRSADGSGGDSDIDRVGHTTSIERLSNRFIFFLVFSLFWMYMGVTNMMFSTFKCEEASDGSRYMSEAAYIVCDSTEHTWMRRAAWVGIPLYVIGIPALLTYFIYRNRNQLDSNTFLGRYGYLYAPFKDELRYWSLFVLLARKFLLVIVVTMLEKNNAYLPFCAFIVLLSSGLIHLWYLPYRHKLDNRIEGFLLALAASTYFARVISLMEGVQSRNALMDAMFNFNVVVGIILLIVMVSGSILKGVKSIPYIYEMFKDEDEDQNELHESGGFEQLPRERENDTSLME